MVIAARNEEAVLPALLRRLQAMDWLAAGWAEPAGLLLADGGSSDATLLLAAEAGCVVVREAGTRGAQWNAAVRQAPGEVLWFLHADTLPPPQAPGLIREALRPAGVVGGGFALRFEPDSPALRAVAWGSDLRARRCQVFFGDQAPFVRRPAFEAVGGYPDEPLLEDLLLGRRLRALGRLAWIPQPVTTSSRRFRRGGVLRTLLLMQWLKLLLTLGVAPRRLARMYR